MEKRTGKVRFKNCWTGCPYQAIYDSVAVAMGGEPDEATVRNRDRACRECRLPDRPTWECAVVDRFLWSTLPPEAPYWLKAGVGFIREMR